MSLDRVDSGLAATYRSRSTSCMPARLISSTCSTLLPAATAGLLWKASANRTAPASSAPPKRPDFMFRPTMMSPPAVAAATPLRPAGTLPCAVDGVMTVADGNPECSALVRQGDVLPEQRLQRLGRQLLHTLRQFEQRGRLRTEFQVRQLK